MAPSPFVIFGLPRSRTAWLSKFLTYGEWFCGHEELRHMRSLQDVRSWLSQPCTGSAETTAGPWWRLLSRYSPSARVVVVRRPVYEVLGSLLKLGIPFDREALEKALPRLNAKLAQIERRMPNVLSVRFADLEREDVCSAVFEHCLPYRHDRRWWGLASPLNIQCSMPAMVRYAAAFKPQMDKLGDIAKHAILADLTARKIEPPVGFTFQEEDFKTWFVDGQALFHEHSIEVGEHPQSVLNKNLPLMSAIYDLGNMQIVSARSNGRMFGYLMTIINPSLEGREIKSSVHTAFYASRNAPGIGLKLQRFAIERLRAREVDEVFMRAGPRGSGPKMSALYRRLGAQPEGDLYRLNFKGN